jgi:hypothetical protein
MLTFYTPTVSPRFYYCVELLCTQIWQISYEIVHEWPLSDDKKSIVYDIESKPDAYHIIPEGLLNEYSVTDKQIRVTQRTDSFRYSFFETTSRASIDFDILSAIFYLISRYEEYIEPITDNHSRYICTQSLAYKSGFLELPLVNIWAESLRIELEQHFGISIPQKHTFSIINTIDIDNAFALKNKGWWRTIGGFGKSLVTANFSQFNKRMKVMLERESDPYETYDFILTTAEKADIKTIFFILLGDYDRFDKNSSYSNKNFRKLLRELSKKAEVGIHPSYASFLRLEHVGKEKKRLQQILEKPILTSRQHFLRLQLPDSYRILAENNIQHDYTMGYPEQPGFRASICTPFTFFDIYANEIVPLTIHPFSYMDGTLNEYMKLTPEDALHKINELKAVVKQYNGEFIGIWHNDTVGENYHWKGWRKVFEFSLRH